ncbi:MAG: DUF2848 domain-containing protein [Limnohabitans sp.]|nr:DUF2848 domain-containing protein [Limnohabitans sp.]
MTTLHFAAACLDGQTSHTRLLTVTPTELVIAGWTGRNHAAIEHHIHELEALGVPRPSTVPLYYRVSHQQLTQADTVQALGVESSGEAEPVLFFTQGEWWLTVGSDHTDRQVETYSVAVSKQMCAKPLARVAWRWSDVVARQDALWLRSRIWEDGAWVLYQEGQLSGIRPLESLRDGYWRAGSVLEGCFMFCGTFAAKPNAKGVAIRPAERMQLELEDAEHHRHLSHTYATQTLPVVS